MEVHILLWKWILAIRISSRSSTEGFKRVAERVPSLVTMNTGEKHCPAGTHGRGCPMEVVEAQHEQGQQHEESRAGGQRSEVGDVHGELQRGVGQHVQHDGQGQYEGQEHRHAHRHLLS